MGEWCHSYFSMMRSCWVRSWSKCFMWWCQLITAVTTRIAITKALVTEMSVGYDEVEGQLNGSDGGRLSLRAGGLW